MAEFDDQHSRVPESVFLGVLWALTGTSFLFVIFRIYAQLASFRQVFLDGYLVVFAWVIMLTAAVIWQVEGKVLYELYAISAGTKPFNLEFLPRYDIFMRFNAPLQILFYSALWCVKFSFMALFYRISAKVKSLRIWWYVVLFCTGSVYIASVADIEYKCSFGGLEYIITQCPQLHHIHYENRMFWANCAGDITTDLMILSIPFLVLWKTRISLRKKLILLSIFSATIFIMVTAIIRVAVGMDYDRQMNIDWLCFWSFVEVDVAIIVSCVASLRQLFVASQNQSSSARAAYHDTNDPILKRSKEGSSQDLSRSVGDVGSPANDEVPMSPLSVVHVRQDFEVSRANASQSVNGEKACRPQTSFD
ncbi:Pc16g07010 [Penicillium rubens Wisconsin 54-1255]|uniref:Pc16g07010 protein n=1 Tax=Penicillium rubens (strain ATCC 28089 / DSM 1075 / NRRL 1951 / Wisconsin 54-1255) TaxID=500485 RepID=B6H7U5_PENRW|nr:Pc16g07010 [Penicillium rubens Wisconsin 54-1255]